MLWRDISKILGLFFLGFSLVFTLPLVMAAYYEFGAAAEGHPQPHSTVAFLITWLVTAAFGGGLYLLGRKTDGIMYRREALLVVVSIWFLIPFFGSLPFLFSGTLSNPFQAYFEATSGFTTTGGTVLYPKKYDETGAEIPYRKIVEGAQDIEYVFYGTVAPVIDKATGKVLFEGIEALGVTLLFWRSLTQWIGGGGIVVLFVAVLPALGVGGRQLFYQEVTGPVKEGITPRIKETAMNLWKIYLVISLLQVFFLMLTNDEMPFFDSLMITFANVSTGGFCIKNTSIGFYDNPATDWVCIIFMLLGSINFTLYFYLLTGKFFKLYDRELFLFLGLIFVQSALCSVEIVGTPNFLLDGRTGESLSLTDAVRVATFHVVSAQSSTGFSTANFDLWPYPAQVVILVAMFLGGMGGSTAGGIKTMRLYILFRVAQFKVESLFRPETVRRFRIGNSEIEWEAVIRVLCFFLIVIAFTALSTYLLVLDGIDPESALGIVTATINNAGIGFRIVGPAESFAPLSDRAIGLASFLMILGRLEFLAILAILVPAFWRNK
ncbi:TrkH family potassium uptake protein [Estrella lausannensis]|uniref:Trk-type K+ transport system, permease subunit n=1 Tax=Estrella lausannensis TaxID=483423 RepID=A0A0H5DMQ3_9BACT|nr:potassium transporter TrkG [Estrella lausannensis]CRX37421.1 Trk-type K+ transport system, permease subunit [Estrella lausannensis]